DPNPECITAIVYAEDEVDKMKGIDALIITSRITFLITRCESSSLAIFRWRIIVVSYHLRQGNRQICRRRGPRVCRTKNPLLARCYQPEPWWECHQYEEMRNLPRQRYR